jgi:hypothetical protein
MLRAAPLSFLLLLACFLALPRAIDAGTFGQALAPKTLVIDVVGYSTFQNAFDSGQAAGLNVTFQLSANDPDQINGSYQYNLTTIPGTPCLFAQGPNVNGSCNPAPLTLHPIPNRPTWVEASLNNGSAWFVDTGCDVNTDMGCALTGAASNGTFRLFVVTAANTTQINPTATQSCYAYTDVSKPNTFTNSLYVHGNGQDPGDPPTVSLVNQGYASCGENATISPPLGTTATVTSPYANPSNPGGSSVTNFTAAFSAQDPDQVNGSYNYYGWASYVQPGPLAVNQTITCGLSRTGVHECVTIAGTLDINQTGGDLPGVKSWQTFGQGPSGGAAPLWVWASARDNLTHQRSFFGCTAQVMEGTNGSANACGTEPPTGLAGYIIGAPQGPPTSPVFPGVNVASLSAGVGVSQTTMGFFLGAILIVAGAGGGLLFAKTVGAIVGTVCAVTATFLLDLWPMWLLIVFFIVLMALAVSGFVAHQAGGTKG